jgi:anti-sigma regulatory factor (Ser/Thr protein kinase)/predicted ArsR family transcriptional regulator
MDWLLSPATAEAGSALRREIGAFLRRHASDGAAVPAAELVVGELIANAVQHAGGPVWVSVDWESAQPLLTVHDLGPTFEPDWSRPNLDGPRGRGVFLASQFAADLAVAAKAGGGNRVTSTLTVTRRVEPSFDPPARTINPLPAAAEAGPAGFGREPFLRALVVELARAVEESEGPATTERLVARVGATVGGQMEAEYRRARATVGRLTPEQLAECFVRLKGAIDGDFYAIEVSDERIVLGNRRCPFGDAVRASPSLCRMTSSVFGGIAARNGHGAAVRLPERIAVGDPECRVVVLLAPAPDEPGHRYAGAAPDRTAYADHVVT